MRVGGATDWRVDYLAFELTRPPTRPLYDPDGSVSKQRAHPPTVFNFWSLPVEERTTVVLFDRRQPQQLNLTFQPTFHDDIEHAERRIALRNIFTAPADEPLLNRALAAVDRHATVDNAVALARGTTDVNEQGARVTVTRDGYRVGEPFFTYRNAMAWWFRYRYERWAIWKYDPPQELIVEEPRYDNKVDL